MTSVATIIDMRFRRRSPLPLLLLLPSLAHALAGPALVTRHDLKSTEKSTYADDDADEKGPVPVQIVPTDPKIRPDIGTKDAPVDGLDGKPHAGPWVEGGVEKGSKDKKKASKESTDDSDLRKPAPKKPAPRPAGETAIPEVNDGVMDDPHRLAPKKGTTGTEGGVSEKARVQKAHEGQTGAKMEKKPDSPKEPPPLPHSEEPKTKGKGKNDETSDTDLDRDGDEGTGKSKASKGTDPDEEAKRKQKGEIGGLAVSPSPVILK